MGRLFGSPGLTAARNQPVIFRFPGGLRRYTVVFSLVKPVVVHLTGPVGLTHPPLWPHTGRMDAICSRVAGDASNSPPRGVLGKMMRQFYPLLRTSPASFKPLALFTGTQRTSMLGCRALRKTLARDADRWDWPASPPDISAAVVRDVSIDPQFVRVSPNRSSA
jgi:hypothetical protein